MCIHRIYIVVIASLFIQRHVRSCITTHTHPATPGRRHPYTILTTVCLRTEPNSTNDFELRRIT